jgi:hypothetical protein
MDSHKCLLPGTASTSRVYSWICSICGREWKVAWDTVGLSWWEEIRGPSLLEEE